MVYYKTKYSAKGSSLSSLNYRFGYQGSEKDNEVNSSNGTSYTTEFRQLYTRLGRWFSSDPVFQPWQSSYTSMDNNPVNLTDVLGDCTDCKKERQESDSEKNKGFWGSVRGFLGFDKNGDASYLLDEIVITATKKEPSQQKQEQTMTDK